MMLHEAAVMLEIYRQALNASEMASPRCQSRDSSSGGRCPSDESVYSGRGGGTGLSPVSLQNLPATLPPAALLPQHSAAMAAYLNVAAAAAAQQNRLLMGSSPMRHHSMHRERSVSPGDNDEPVLDFSKKRKASSDASDSNDENNSDNDMNMMKNESSPLDLSVSRKRATNDDSPQHSPRKMRRPGHDFKPSIVTPWTSPVAAQLPFFANAVAAAGLSPKTDWNGKSKMQHHSLPSDATKALEKMSELSRLGEDMFRASTNASNSSNSNNNSHHHHNNNSHGNSGSGISVGATTTGRHSAWQSHWLNKGADSAKDVLKCVWCKQSFPSLAAMTTHMKETKHCGVSVPPQSSGGHNQQSQHSQSQHNSQHNSHNSNSKSDLNLLIKETMPLPRKLVRGQDVWLGKGAEQTRQILKCMWCGQSFRTLSEMTTHMQQTQHYTNIISQEQIISWKSGGGGAAGAAAGATATGNSGSNSGSGNDSNSTEKATSTNTGNAAGGGGGGNNNSSNSTAASATTTNSHVSAVLTCKVCDQAFSSLKELSNHMVKNAHYKEHIMRSITESGSRRRQTREKRKKSLPVRKLLELERAQNDFKNGSETTAMLNKPLRDISAGRITCEKCGDKIDTALFVDHIRQCIGSSMSPAQKLKTALMSNTIIPPDSVSPVITPNSRDGRKSISDSDMTSPSSLRQRSPVSTNSLDLSSKSTKDASEKTSSSPSVLNAIEQLIEKSFDTRSRHGSTNFPSVQNSQTLGSSILKRLGIDESCDYTKPLVDAQTMTLLRNYHNQQTYLASQFARRERSGSESSSISERGSSRVDSLTPEKKYDVHANSPDTNNSNKQQQQRHHESDDDKPLKIKRELVDDGADDKQNNMKVRIKKESRDVDDDNEHNMRNSSRESANQHMNSNETEDEDDDKPLKLIKSSNRSPQASPSAANSPLSDHHSVASRSTPSEGKKSRSIGSLGALSSMFDNLGNADKAGTENGQGKRSKAHPLAALQKLCDKTENTPNSRSNSNSQLAASPSLQSNNNRTGAILAFSWACNDGMVQDEANFKCAYCDTTFSSKGAYRHHLSKAHFVNDDVIPEAVPLKANSNKLPPPSQSPKSPLSISPKSNVSVEVNRGGGGGNGLAHLMKKSPSPVSAQSSSSNDRHHSKSDAQTSSAAAAAAAAAAFDESPHSKFLKYTELAKQLSSKYV